MPSPSPITLSVDCMGGDHGPRVTLAACRRFLQGHPQAHLLLVGRPEALTALRQWLASRHKWRPA